MSTHVTLCFAFTFNQGTLKPLRFFFTFLYCIIQQFCEAALPLNLNCIWPKIFPPILKIRRTCVLLPFIAIIASNMARNADNFPNYITLSASAQQFHNSLLDDQNLTYENFWPSIVPTPINSDYEVSISEQIGDSSDISEESFEESCTWSVAHSVLGISNKKANTGNYNRQTCSNFL